MSLSTLVPSDKLQELKKEQKEKVMRKLLLIVLKISKPESSAKQVIFVFLEKYLALIKEFSLKVFPFSMGLLIPLQEALDSLKTAPLDYLFRDPLGF